MYVVEFHNLEANELVDRASDAHKAFLARYVQAGVIVAAGQKVPRDGGIIVVGDVPRAELDAMLAEDPFLKNGSARCTIKEFRSSFVMDALKKKA